MGSVIGLASTVTSSLLLPGLDGSHTSEPCLAAKRSTLKDTPPCEACTITAWCSKSMAEVPAGAAVGSLLAGRMASAGGAPPGVFLEVGPPPGSPLSPYTCAIQ